VEHLATTLCNRTKRRGLDVQLISSYKAQRKSGCQTGLLERLPMNWNVKSNGADGWLVTDDAGRVVANVVTVSEDGEEVRSSDEAFTLASTLAAVPDMRAALERLTNLAHAASMGYPSVTPELLDTAAERGVAALRSARGLPARPEAELARERLARAQTRAAMAAGRAA
jgi:hypothetical protein